MRHLTSIVAVNQDSVIGAGNTLPWKLRTDLKFFRKQTVNNVVIMGRKTFDSLGGPLKDRVNVIVTHGFGLFEQSNSCFVAHSIEEAIAVAENKKSKRQDVFVVGGATMYAQFAQYVDRYLITDVDKFVPEADTFFRPEVIGPLEHWDFKPILEGDGSSDGDEAPFRTYELNAKDPSPFTERRELAVFRHQERSHMRKPKFTSKATFAELRSNA